MEIAGFGRTARKCSRATEDCYWSATDFTGFVIQRHIYSNTLPGKTLSGCIYSVQMMTLNVVWGLCSFVKDQNDESHLWTCKWRKRWSLNSLVILFWALVWDWIHSWPLWVSSHFMIPQAGGSGTSLRPEVREIASEPGLGFETNCLSWLGCGP